MDIVQGCGTCALPHLPADKGEEVESRPCRYPRPACYGVMIVCTGKATKRIEEFQYHTKEYVATIRLGATTPSYDLEHEIDATYPTEHITRGLVEETLKKFIGEIQQVPPAFSACMVNGKRAYDLARKGEEVELKPKLLVIDEIELLDDGLDIAETVDKGTRSMPAKEPISAPWHVTSAKPCRAALTSRPGAYPRRRRPAGRLPQSPRFQRVDRGAGDRYLVISYGL